MTDRDDQLKAFRGAVDRKSDAAREASHHPEQNAVGEDVSLDGAGMEPGIQTNDRGSQDVFSTRAKNTGHGKKTADKWNQ
jgi:hypothetical protein